MSVLSRSASRGCAIAKSPRLEQQSLGTARFITLRKIGPDAAALAYGKRLVSRIYKDGDIWKSTESFGRDDLLLLAKVADKVHSWIHQKEQEEAGNKKPLVETNATPPAQ